MNCRNCGAPPSANHQCEYCGTLAEGWQRVSFKPPLASIPPTPILGQRGQQVRFGTVPVTYQLMAGLCGAVMLMMTRR